MQETIDPLIRELLTWISSRPRTYEEAMEAWQTTCPRHTVWEDALIDGLIQVENGSGSHRAEVTLTPQGKAILNRTQSHK
jgi:hypothetical protein